MFHDEYEYIERICKYKDRQAANDLIDKYYKKVYKEIYRRMSDKELAMDLTQETFLAMLKGLSGYDRSKSSFWVWLSHIAANKVIDYSRSRAYHEAGVTQTIDECEYEQESGQNVEQDIIVGLTAAKVYDALQKENIQTRNIFEMKARQGYTFDEIGKALQLPEGTVKSRYYTVVRKMRKELKGYE